MKRFVAIAGLVSAVSCFAPPAVAQPFFGPTPGGQPITVVGCTRPGTTAQCVILETRMPGVRFSLHSANPVPAYGRAAAVTGWVGGVDGCLEGAVMNVTSWHYVKGRKPDPLCRPMMKR